MLVFLDRAQLLPVDLGARGGQSVDVGDAVERDVDGPGPGRPETDLDRLGGLDPFQPHHVVEVRFTEFRSVRISDDLD
ncbi:hypothetical protein ACFU8Q_24395 [Streptomyces sp. NPDC057543]|uniref:hypothetical protein n=1 Tax=Streptomyces sp. NPDC057543 TaxID=3346163 RepID=UPI003689AC15